ncbi:uncharacterized protein LOC126291914 [Schistocerca gregaria]|uniref:uncharacterized protein LOC126291914 n=1 Tax=Schistocerca gregaria TaxID=7010 RepID=UPI00211E49B8|nr:uncharacterized protein LOC126291914 [Schistocerca gregaria]
MVTRYKVTRKSPSKQLRDAGRWRKFQESQESLPSVVNEREEERKVYSVSVPDVRPEMLDFSCQVGSFLATRRSPPGETATEQTSLESPSSQSGGFLSRVEGEIYTVPVPTEQPELTDFSCQVGGFLATRGGGGGPLGSLVAAVTGGAASSAGSGGSPSSSEVESSSAVALGSAAEQQQTVKMTQKDVEITQAGKIVELTNGDGTLEKMYTQCPPGDTYTICEETLRLSRLEEPTVLNMSLKRLVRVGHPRGEKITFPALEDADCIQLAPLNIPTDFEKLRDLVSKLYIRRGREFDINKTYKNMVKMYSRIGFDPAQVWPDSHFYTRHLD